MLALGNMNNKQTIGGKTIKLKDLKSLGLNVPKFTYIKSTELPKTESEFKTIAKNIHMELHCEKYAVRSSALIEDTQTESYAGQFKTEIDVSPKDLCKAIESVVEHASKFLKRNLEKFSVLIQEYFEPEISGITFTRNPTEGREMIIEYHKGRGEEIVGGKTKPKKIQFYWSSLPKPSLPELGKAIENFKKIEKFYKSPQDIEWCIKDDKWYFLQTRPITTVSQEQHKQNLYLDKVLPKNKKFFFEKTEISEISPRPTEITKSLLKKIYEKNGPIDQVYKKYKIIYKPTNTIQIIGNELYVDREEELHSLLPSYSFLKSEDLTPKFNTLSGFFTTFKNSFRLRRISLKNHDKLFKILKQTLEVPQKTNNTNEFLNQFFKKYKLVFEINLLTGLSIQNLERSLEKEDINPSLVLGHGNQLFENKIKFDINFDSQNLKGNMLEVSDETEFIQIEENKSQSQELQKWWNNLSRIKKEILTSPIKHAIIYSRLRELSRWLVIKLINELRKILMQISEKNNFSFPKNIYYAKLEEVLSNTLSESKCEKRKSAYLKYLNFNFPKSLTCKPISQSTKKPTGVSPGRATGILVSEKELKNNKFQKQDKILFTKILSPELTKHFSQIKGIVSEQGGLLSHLAIIAREKSIPTIVNFHLNYKNIKIEDKIEINGSTGEIIKKQ